MDHHLEDPVGAEAHPVQVGQAGAVGTFKDGYAKEMATVEGTNSAGYTATLAIGIP